MKVPVYITEPGGAAPIRADLEVTRIASVVYFHFSYSDGRELGGHMSINAWQSLQDITPLKMSDPRCKVEP